MAIKHGRGRIKVNSVFVEYEESENSCIRNSRNAVEKKNTHIYTKYAPFFFEISVEKCFETKNNIPRENKS